MEGHLNALCLIKFHSTIFSYSFQQLFNILVLLFNLHSESKILTYINTNGRPDMLTRKVFNKKFI